MTSSFTETFGGSSVSPSDIAFASYTFGSNLVLYWPPFSYGQTDIAARFMNLTASTTALNVSMPDATLVSVGYDVIIFNPGSNTFNVVDFDGGAIATIASGQTYYLLLNNNATQAGGWQTVQFGVGTGSASAAALAGNGLIALAGLLNVNMSAAIQSMDYSIVSGNRAQLQVWTGGVGTITLPTAASVGDGFFFPLANNGGGSVTVTAVGGNTIDGELTSVFTQTQSGFIVSSGFEWYTVGKGLQNNLAVTLLNLNVGGSSDVTETSAQAQNIIQQFTGALTGNINVIVPAAVQLYYIFNNTSGSHTLTVKTASGSGIVVPQGAHVILYCDGTNIISAFTSNTTVLGTPFYAIGNVGGTANTLTGSASNFILQLGTFVTFNPVLFNTGAATLNVQGTGAIPLKRLTATGLIDLYFEDLVPGLPIIVYYDSAEWIVINLVYDGVYESEATNFSLGFGSWLNSVVCTATLNATLVATNTLPPYYYTTIFAQGGAVTLIPDAADSIQGLSVGAHYILPQGASARLATDGAGKWTLLGLNIPTITDDTAINATMYPVWVSASTGTPSLEVSSTKLTFNPSSGVLTSTGFFGPLTGNVVGNVTGNVSGNAGTVTTNANLTGAVTSVGNATSLGSFTSAQLAGALTDETGTGFAVFSTSPTLITPALGTPASGVATNLTGTASGLTAGNVTTNANLTGPVTSVGNATTIANGVVTEAMQVLANNTTNNVSISKHGYAPILPNDATKYLDGTGLYSKPQSLPISVTGTLSGSNTVFTVDFTTYSSYLLSINDITKSGITDNVTVDVSINGGGSYVTAARVGFSVSGATVSAVTGGEAMSDSGKAYINGTISQSTTTADSILSYNSHYDLSITQSGNTIFSTSAAINRVKITIASGTFGSGNVILQPISIR